MAYELDDIKYSQRIFIRLIEKRQLTQEEDRELYRSYTEKEEVQALVKSQAEEAECQIERYGSVIYLIPKESNEVLGFSKAELKNALCKSNATDKDYYLSQFVILTLLVEFYDANGRTSKSRTYMKGGELMNKVGERLAEGAKRALEAEVENQVVAREDEDKDSHTEETNQAERKITPKKGLAFASMLETYEALKSEEHGSRARTTKEGFLYNILNFLQKQGLIVYVEADDYVQTTEKLDHFMDWNILNRNHYDRVLTLLGVKVDE